MSRPSRSSADSWVARPWRFCARTTRCLKADRIVLELDLPAYAATELYLACVEGMRDTTAALYQTGENGIQLAEEEFFDTAAKGEFSSVVVDRCPSSEVTALMMDQLYTRRLARRGTRARRYYDELRSATPNGVCPFCAHRQVATLDHYMPKSRFPDLAVTPANLVPACSDCNKAKLDQLPATNLEAVIHPFYDRLGGATWLGAEVIEAVPTGLRFSCPRMPLSTLISCGGLSIILCCINSPGSMPRKRPRNS